MSARDRPATSRPWCWLLAGLAAVGVSCRTPDSSGAASTIELARTLDGAELRPSAASFSRTLIVLAGRDAVAIVAPAASRVTWPLRLPPHADRDIRNALKDDIDSFRDEFRLGRSEWQALRDQWIADRASLTPEQWAQRRADWFTARDNWIATHRDRVQMRDD